ncbi:hypothetical protein LXA43DRAFT_552392 [Ganoderma leucocontextum]|nr:hypothetical protein LXA43DRAFT_552392 [Ganoderma leucocontextum]
MPNLYIDLLRLICSFITDVATVLSFSLTCYTLRHDAVARRLNMRPIYIRHGLRSLQDLQNFILVDEERRYPNIRVIDTSINPSRAGEVDFVDSLLAMFESASRLHTLSILVAAWGGDWLPMGTLSGLAEVKSLRELCLVSPTSFANDLFGSLRSPLRTFRFDNTEQGPYLINPRINFRVPPQLTSTLQEVDLKFEFVVAAANASIPLPAVRSVTLTNVFQPFSLGILLTLFPNLDRTLILHTYTRDREGCDNQDQLDALRRESKEAASTTRSWKAVDRVAGLSGPLYALGLICPIRHLTISVACESDPRRIQASPDFARVCAIIEDCAPTHLALVDIGLLGQGLRILDDSLFLGDAAARLSHLVLVTRSQNPIPLEPDLDEPSWNWTLVSTGRHTFPFWNTESYVTDGVAFDSTVDASQATQTPAFDPHSYHHDLLLFHIRWRKSLLRQVRLSS